MRRLALERSTHGRRDSRLRMAALTSTAEADPDALNYPEHQVGLREPRGRRAYRMAAQQVMDWMLLAEPVSPDGT